MNSPTNKPPEHPDALLLPYVEKTLGPDDLTVLAAHLAECERCSSEVEALRRITTMLRDNKQVLCPEASEIYEVANRGEKARGLLSRHLEQCPQCRAELESYFEAEASEPMPRELWSKVRERLTDSAVEPRMVEEPSPDLWERFNRWFRLPALGVAAAAAIVIVLLVFPREGAHLPTWEHVPRPKVTMGIDRPRTALVILLKDFKKPLSGKQTYDLYQALEPSIDVVEKYDMLAPATMSKVIGQGTVDAHDRRELLAGLRSDLNVSLAVLITVTPAAEGFSVESELVNVATGTPLAEKTAKAPREQDLAPVMRDAAWDLLLRQGPPKQ